MVTELHTHEAEQPVQRRKSYAAAILTGVAVVTADRPPRVTISAGLIIVFPIFFPLFGALLGRLAFQFLGWWLVLPMMPVALLIPLWLGWRTIPPAPATPSPRDSAPVRRPGKFRAVVQALLLRAALVGLVLFLAAMIQVLHFTDLWWPGTTEAYDNTVIP